MIATEAEKGEDEVEEEEESAVAPMAYQVPKAKAPRPQKTKNPFSKNLSNFKLQTSVSRF